MNDGLNYIAGILETAANGTNAEDTEASMQYIAARLNEVEPSTGNIDPLPVAEPVTIHADIINTVDIPHFAELFMGSAGYQMQILLPFLLILFMSAFGSYMLGYIKPLTKGE